jgi:hypothetical protein
MGNGNTDNWEKIKEYVRLGLSWKEAARLVEIEYFSGAGITLSEREKNILPGLVKKREELLASRATQ